MRYLRLLAVVFVWSFIPVVGMATEASQLSPDQALAKLMAGNARFVSGQVIHPDTSAARRDALANGQYPMAVVVGCSDSRTPPEIIFDQGLGDLFVVRVAGQAVADDSVNLGSIEYGAEHLHAPLLIVLGHEKCGAVAATLKGEKLPGHLESLIDAIKPAVEASKDQPGDPLDNAINENIRLIVKKLKSSDPILEHLVEAGQLKVVGARYDFHTGLVTIIDEDKTKKGTS